MRRTLFPVAAAFLGVILVASAQDDAKKARIEGLIRHVEGLKDTKFVRNGTAYDAATAAKFLRGKWERATKVKTADDFIREVGSVSSTTGRPYLLRFRDGTEQKAGDYLRGVLKKLDQPEKE